MKNQIICSQNHYSRSEAENKLKSLKWYMNSDQEVQRKIVDLPESFDGFLNDLCDRPEIFSDFEVIKMEDLFINDHFAHAVFQVKSIFTGVTSQKVYTSWKKGVYHSMRGIMLLETENVVTHFIVRKCSRFAICREIEESMGSIYPPGSMDQAEVEMITYIEDQFAKQMRVPSLTFSKYFDLGYVYPDPAMSDNAVGLFASILKNPSYKTVEQYVNGKKYDDKGYAFSFSIKPISELLNFLSETNDSFLLAIFGRLQALNVIKL